MKTFKNSKKAGISLVALVITIIVLIILTGAVIVTFMEGGIIDRAKEAVFKNDMRTYQEILALKRAENQMEIALGEKDDIEINASTLAEIQEIIPEFKEEYEGLVVITKGELSIGERVSGEELSSSEELYATWLGDLGIGLSRLPSKAIANYVQVGDYVVYTPEGNNATSYELLGTDSGYFTNTTTKEVVNQTITRQNINWRVLKNDGRQVTLISEEPVVNIGLGGSKGFVNGPDLLDDIYNTLYSSSKTVEVRNLKIEDINELMGIVVGEDVKPYYWNTSGKRIEMDKEATFGDALDIDGYDISSWNISDDNYRNYKLSYSYTGSTYKTRNEEAYKLIFRNASDTDSTSPYWLSSNSICIEFWDDYGRLYMYCIYKGFEDEGGSGIGSCELSSVFGSFYKSEQPGRPIVILNSDVEVLNPSASGNTVATAWQLK